MSAVQQIQQALIGWVKMIAPTLPKRLYADYRGSVGPVIVSRVPFPVSLYRFEPALIPGHHFQFKHVVTNSEQARLDRIKQAIEGKFPKLAGWKRDHNARTVLVLEDNDIQPTNQSIVVDTYLRLANGKADRPDEIYVVASCMDPWRAWPILIDDKTYFDLEQQYGADVGWPIDQHSLTPLTKR